ncbi:MAG: tRNA (adenosine(37)-N6)-dimethylallyltransferase MiaA [Oscillospiraceae bacterium]|nr:tRNA (adenosine(37)-N6)-dimethylallyltransferase MiaA [Oscillospiraceae bacterium]
MEKLICVVGPTASGKTGLAIELCKRLDGEVLSCDSMQLYRDMDIGTAKPTPDEMQGIPHHMISCIDPADDYSVGRYVAQAEPILQDILARGKTCVIVGGTGLYVDSLIAGRSFAPYPQTGRRQALEQRADAEGMQAMLSYLAGFDPDAAARLHPSDRKRILRACEVYEETGISITAHDRQTQRIPPKHAPVWLGLDFADRADLYARIDLRVEQMLAAGLAEEVRALLARGVPDSATAMQAIGYREMVAALGGRCSAEQAAEAIKLATRRYAKRQRTWFRRNQAIHWLIRRPETENDEILQSARRHIPFFDKSW